MARQMLMMMWCVLILGLFKPTDSVMLKITPEVFEERVTRSVTIDCTFSYGDTTKITNLVSLMLSRSDNIRHVLPDFTDLASINEFNPSQPEVITQFGARVNGKVITNGNSFLRHTWRNPTKAVAGIYRCSALGVDKLGSSILENDFKKLRDASVDEELEFGNAELKALLKKITKCMITIYNLAIRDIVADAKLDQILRDFQAMKANISMAVDDLSIIDSDLEALKFMVGQMTDGFGTFSYKFEILKRTLVKLKEKLSGEGSGRNVTAKPAFDMYTALAEVLFFKSPVYKGRHYLLSKEAPESDHWAEVSCLLQGGYLAEINDAMEHNFLKSFVRSLNSKEKYWVLVGPNNAEYPGSWVFHYSKQVATYTNWAPGYPTIMRPTCVFLKRNGHWNMANSECLRLSYYVSFLCEIPV